MLGIDNRGHRVRGCPSPQPSPRHGVPAAQAQRGAPSGERESDRVCDRLCSTSPARSWRRPSRRCVRLTSSTRGWGATTLEPYETQSTPDRG